MKHITLCTLLGFGLFLGGCAHEASYIDKEYGVASSAAFDQQIVHKDYKYANKDADGIDAIYMENSMGKYADTYKAGFTQEKIDINTFDVDTK